MGLSATVNYLADALGFTVECNRHGVLKGSGSLVFDYGIGRELKAEQRIMVGRAYGGDSRGVNAFAIVEISKDLGAAYLAHESGDKYKFFVYFLDLSKIVGDSFARLDCMMSWDKYAFHEHIAKAIVAGFRVDGHSASPEDWEQIPDARKVVEEKLKGRESYVLSAKYRTKGPREQ